MEGYPVHCGLYHRSSVRRASHNQPLTEGAPIVSSRCLLVQPSCNQRTKYLGRRRKPRCRFFNGLPPQEAPGNARPPHLKSVFRQRECGFNSRPGHQLPATRCAPPDGIVFFIDSRSAPPYPTCTVSIEIDPPSTPSTGNVTPSVFCRVPIAYNNGR